MKTSPARAARNFRPPTDGRLGENHPVVVVGIFRLAGHTFPALRGTVDASLFFQSSTPLAVEIGDRGVVVCVLVPRGRPVWTFTPDPDAFARAVARGRAEAGAARAEARALEAPAAEGGRP